VYFDAHPDFVNSTTNYYGSVINDVLSNIETASSIQIGIRTPEATPDLFHIQAGQLPLN